VLAEDAPKRRIQLRRKKNTTAATPTKFNGGVTDFQQRRCHKNSTRRVDEIRRRLDRLSTAAAP
jgi:hypothetical protein